MLSLCPSKWRMQIVVVMLEERSKTRPDVEHLQEPPQPPNQALCTAHEPCLLINPNLPLHHRASPGPVVNHIMALIFHKDPVS